MSEVEEPLPSRNPIEVRIDTRRDRGSVSREGVLPAQFRDLLSRWASGVTVVAVRDGGAVYATTVSSFASISVAPPQVLVSLGATAQVLPFLERGTRFVVSVLATGQHHIATVFSDSYPVGPSPFPADGDPAVEGAHVVLICRVLQVLAAGDADARLVLALVEGGAVGEGEAEGRGPLLYYRRTYRTLGSP